MTTLSIPAIEALPGFEQIQDLTISGDRMSFCVAGNTPAFGSAAANLFVSHGLAARFDGREAHLFRADVLHLRGANSCSISCDLPRFVDNT